MHTHNGTSANSILLVKLFYTLEPRAPIKISAKTAAREEQVRREYRSPSEAVHYPVWDVQPLQWVPVHSMDGFLPEQLLWKPYLQLVGDRYRKAAAQIFTGGTGNTSGTNEALHYLHICKYLCWKWVSDSSTLIAEHLEVTKARSPSERQLHFQGSSQCHGWKLAGTKPHSRMLTLVTTVMAGPLQTAVRMFRANRDKAQLTGIHNTWIKNQAWPKIHIRELAWWKPRKARLPLAGFSTSWERIAMQLGQLCPPRFC